MKGVTTEWLNRVVEEERRYGDGPIQIGRRRLNPMAVPALVALAVSLGLLLLRLL